MGLLAQASDDVSSIHSPQKVVHLRRSSLPFCCCYFLRSAIPTEAIPLRVIAWSSNNVKPNGVQGVGLLIQHTGNSYQ